MDELNSEFEQLSLRNNLRKEILTILSNNQSRMNKLIIQSIFTRIESNGLFSDNYFPLDNDDDLKYMENKITEENVTGAEFRSRLVRDLIFIGGMNAKDMVIRLMTKLFTRELLSGYTREGGKKSLRLSGLNIYKVILEAVITKFPNSQDDFDQAISNHLTNAKKTPRTSV